VINRSFVLIISALAIGLSGCATKKVLSVDNSEQALNTKEFDKQIEVKEIPAESSNASGTATATTPAVKVEPTPTAATTTTSRRVAKARSKKKGKILQAPQPSVPTLITPKSASEALAALASNTGVKHEPAIEDGQSFFGRRPAKDPYRVGEKVTMEVSYFAVVGGDMTVEVRNLAEVNGRKSYRFAGTAKSSSVFAMFYAVDDWFETFVDYETLVPQSYALHVKESKQLREVRTVFDWSKKRATYYDKKINEEKKLEQDNKEWDIPEYSQNVFSAAYYLRAFDWRPGIKTSFRVAHEGKNLVLTAEYVRKEKISTAAGDFECVVVKPTISLDGKFTPIGDVFVWMTNDDRKLIVRLESKIKIGKIVAVAKAIDLGRP
jgi:hypothetical protein